MSTIIIIIIVLVYIINQRYKEHNQRIEELENRLNQYYKEREKRLKSKGLIKRGHEWPE
jgi:cell shape-determining protein MreC